MGSGLPKGKISPRPMERRCAISGTLIYLVIMPVRLGRTLERDAAVDNRSTCSGLRSIRSPNCNNNSLCAVKIAVSNWNQVSAVSIPSL